jgi:hypothetical protein
LSSSVESILRVARHPLGVEGSVNAARQARSNQSNAFWAKVTKGGGAALGIAFELTIRTRAIWYCAAQPEVEPPGHGPKIGDLCSIRVVKIIEQADTS